MATKKDNYTFLNKTRVLASQIYNDSVAYLTSAYQNNNKILTPSSPFGQLLSVMSNIGELIMYYITDATNENNIITANNLESIYGLSALTGHIPSRPVSAIGEVRFKFKPGKQAEFPGAYILVPTKCILKSTGSGVRYTMRFNSDYIKVEKNNVDFIYASIIQGEFESQRVIGTGLALQSFNLTTPSLVENDNVRVYINGELWQIYDSLYDMSKDTKGVLVRTGLGGGLDIFFGNGYFGKIPVLGSYIDVEYLATIGSGGNASANSEPVMLKFEDTGRDVNGDEVDLNKFLLIETSKNPTLGSDEENPEFTKLIAPLASKSFVLANPENFEYFLSKFNYFSYIDAYNQTEDDYLDDDNVIYLFLLPDISRKLTSDEDYFSLPLEEFTITADEKKIITVAINESGRQMTSTEIQFVDPEIKKYAVNIVLRTIEGYNVGVIRNLIRTSLNDYFLNVKRRDKIPKSDLVAIIENIEGVDSVSVFFVSEENETAIKNGYYVKRSYKITPTNPFLQEGEGNKKRFIFFNKELIETKITITPGEDPNLGLDEFGDITIGLTDLVVIRGGWYDRDGIYYEPTPVEGKSSSLSIYFNGTVPDTINNRKISSSIKAIKNS
jgi:hypothetical protein